MSQNIIEIKNVSKTYGDNTVLKNLSLNIRKNEFLTLLGPSGCGKTTTLKILAGFESGDSGKVLFNGEDISNLPPYKRQLNTVFQKYALFPHMNVYENIAFGLKIKKVSKNEIDKKVKEAAKILDLGHLLDRKPKALSGGQRQALTLIMAVMSNPKILLLDEHTAALDPKTSIKIMDITDKIIDEKKITTLMVTHNIKQAIESGDRLIMMHEGKIVIDVKREEKSKLNRDKLIEMFGRANMKDVLSDRSLLSTF